MLFELALMTVVQDEFLVVRNLLAGHVHPNFSSESKLRLVADEAQVLSDKCGTKFQSSSLEADLRPMYINMVITYPAEAVNFQVVRPDPQPRLEGLQHVSISIDDNNFLKIFPCFHIDFLDKLKGHKRRSSDQQSRASKKKGNDPHNTTSNNRILMVLVSTSSIPILG